MGKNSKTFPFFLQFHSQIRVIFYNFPMGRGMEKKFTKKCNFLFYSGEKSVKIPKSISKV
ncbi:MAG: hypothetical protein C6I01_05090 [Epsilonproteobacteria bacterium]|nr:hypothetical protein [Campylobacterota bacterium]